MKRKNDTYGNGIATVGRVPWCSGYNIGFTAMRFYDSIRRRNHHIPWIKVLILRFENSATCLPETVHLRLTLPFWRALKSENDFLWK
ncbi:hypothetical protein AVEN_4137-1 [Araneus ventricosus]|uniref:Uncharacterized protein n=1 Tax=Araneus ventricosus TaxID=182803 RepID=A0A4Y2TTL0_ARAVE|nr:hypothetical protein AVEN_4137-1 [Araneus ventricosus]